MADVAWQLLEDSPFRAGHRFMLSRVYQLPNGHVDAFTVIKGNPVVLVVAITPDKQVVVAKQFRPGPNKVMFELPGGAVDEGEDILDAARRELLEETGYRGEMTTLQQYYPSAYSTMVKHICIATNCRKVAEQALDLTECIEVVLMSVEQFMHHIYLGECVDIAAAILGLRELHLI